MFYNIDVVVKSVIGIVLAGGPGIRLLPLTSNKPKALVRLAGQYLYEYSVNELLNARIDEVIVVTPPASSNLFRPRYEGVRLIEQDKAGSLESAIAAAVREAKKLGHDEAALLFTGFLSAPRGMIRYALEFYASSGYPLVISVVPVVSGLETYGFVKLSRADKVEAFGAKALESLPSIKSGYVFAGAMIGSIDSLERLALGNYESELNKIASEGLLGAIVWHGDWVEIGYPWDLLDAMRVAMKLLEPRIDLRARIGRDTVIEGLVVIEEGAVIGSGAVIEGPAYIGRGARIGRNSVVSASIIEPHVTIGDLSLVSESIVMDSAIIHSHVAIRNSIVGDGARIKSFVNFEAGSPRELPERLRDIVSYTREPVKLGAVVAPNTTIESYTRIPPGAVLK